MLTDTNINVDLLPLLNEVSSINWDDKNRAKINIPTGHWLHDPYVINDTWKGSAFEQLLLSLPWPIGEARLIKLEPGTCYRSHSDIDDRYHLNLTGNQYCHLIDLEDQRMYQLVSDGKFYKMNAGKIHTAVNFGSTPRIQLVIRVPIPKIDSPSMVKIKIKGTEIPSDFRYQFDQYMSPVISKLIKEKKIGWVDPKSETEMDLKIEQDEVNKFLDYVGSLDLKILSFVQ
jgi:hypothetical protein